MLRVLGLWMVGIGLCGIGLCSCGHGSEEDRPAGSAGSAPTADSATAGTAGTGGEAIDERAPLSELDSSARGEVCDVVEQQAEAYVSTWTAERLCTLVGASLALRLHADDAAAARAKCAELRDTCLEDQQPLVVLDCAALASCDRTLADVKAYYAAYADLAVRVSSCAELELGALHGADPNALDVMPTCTLVGGRR